MPDDSELTVADAPGRPLTADDMADPGVTLMRAFLRELCRRVVETPADMKAADFEVVRKVLSDNSITLASVQKGEFGEFAQRVAEKYPFPTVVAGGA